MSVEFEKILGADVLEHVRVDLEMLFLHICEEYNITNGDITPNQSQRLSDIEENLKELLVEFINQNS